MQSNLSSVQLTARTKLSVLGYSLGQMDEAAASLEDAASALEDYASEATVVLLRTAMNCLRTAKVRCRKEYKVAEKKLSAAQE